MTIEVCLQLNCSYTTDLIRSVLEQVNERFQWTQSQSDGARALHWLEYEEHDFDLLYRLSKQSNPERKILVNSYCIRKGLLRKANFALFLQQYSSKRPDSILRDHYPDTHILDFSHPDYLDEALNEAFELRDALAKNEETPSQAIPFILKASILDKASELFIFRTQAELEEFFLAKYEEDEEIAHVQQWIVQRYLNAPKLLPTYGNRKFHLRVYVVAQGNLRVYVYDGILALFASLAYNNDDGDRLRHITNTCAQIDSTLSEDDLVKEFSTLVDLDDELRSNIFQQIQSIVREIFAGLHHEMIIFQPLKNAFEIYGFDFLLDEHNQVFFLEANAYPDFKQTGNALKVLIGELFENVLYRIILPYFDENENEDQRQPQRRLHLVYDQQKQN